MPPNAPSLIEQIDTRQNQLLDDIDRLNGRVEALLTECLKARESEQARETQLGE